MYNCRLWVASSSVLAKRLIEIETSIMGNPMDKRHNERQRKYIIRELRRRNLDLKGNKVQNV